ncbi:hypothetical protein [Nocardia sp. NPDC049707]|uniref:hypothetical protein n=1 Tax=Nocardia sp. NPDC049707 TaxID=3154735 RepID=UPI00342235D2
MDRETVLGSSGIDLNKKFDKAGIAVFVKVLTLVKAPFWDSMDDLEVPGLIDNLDAKRIADPAGMSDLDFADAMVCEWNSWVNLAIRAGILREMTH